MGKWLAKIREKNSEPLKCELTKLTKPHSVSNVSSHSGDMEKNNETKGAFVSCVSTPNRQTQNFQPLLDELHQLNQRWQKAEALEQAGGFIGISAEREERICQELRQICGRATEIWETIREHQPELLSGLYLLYP